MLQCDFSGYVQGHYGPLLSSIIQCSVTLQGSRGNSDSKQPTTDSSETTAISEKMIILWVGFGTMC